jgi:glycosyltransferase involved in cell wall biosynthesis
VIRVAFLSPQPAGAVSGNNTTLRRMLRALARRGIDGLAIHLPGCALEDAIARLRKFRPHVVHAIHAFRAGPAAARAADVIGVPLAVTLTGTDLHLDAVDPSRAAAVLRVLLRAAAVLAPAGTGAEQRLLVLGVPAGRIVEVPKGVDLPPRAEVEALIARERAGGSREIVFLLPAGWREVKNNLFPLEPLTEARRRAPSIRLRYVGPAIDRAYRERLDPDRFPFAEDGGAVPPESMGAEYARASVALNVSHAEGGANAVLEAMGWGRAVLASDIEGNRAFIEFHEDDPGGGTGILYPARPSAVPGRKDHDAADFARKALLLALDPDLRVRLGLRARDAAERDHSPEAEADAVLAGYRLCGGEV